MALKPADWSIRPSATTMDSGPSRAQQRHYAMSFDNILCNGGGNGYSSNEYESLRPQARYTERNQRDTNDNSVGDRISQQWQTQQRQSHPAGNFILTRHRSIRKSSPRSWRNHHDPDGQSGSSGSSHSPTPPNGLSCSRKGRVVGNFGKCIDGRFYCTYHCFKTAKPCDFWPDGYTTVYDLFRHVEADHAPEEVDLIEKGFLDYNTAQWIRSADTLNYINQLQAQMVCDDCGMKFSSNRQDSKSRHKQKGACLRRQEKRRKLELQTLCQSKKKGSKTRDTNKRR